jgi:hypothetical protein
VFPEIVKVLHYVARRGRPQTHRQNLKGEKRQKKNQTEPKKKRKAQTHRQSLKQKLNFLPNLLALLAQKYKNWRW